MPRPTTDAVAKERHQLFLRRICASTSDILDALLATELMSYANNKITPSYNKKNQKVTEKNLITVLKKIIQKPKPTTDDHYTCHRIWAYPIDEIKPSLPSDGWKTLFMSIYKSTQFFSLRQELQLSPNAKQKTSSQYEKNMLLVFNGLAKKLAERQWKLEEIDNLGLLLDEVLYEQHAQSLLEDLNGSPEQTNPLPSIQNTYRLLLNKRPSILSQFGYPNVTSYADVLADVMKVKESTHRFFTTSVDPKPLQMAYLTLANTAANLEFQRDPPPKGSTEEARNTWRKKIDADYKQYKDNNPHSEGALFGQQIIQLVWEYRFKMKDSDAIALLQMTNYVLMVRGNDIKKSELTPIFDLLRSPLDKRRFSNILFFISLMLIIVSIGLFVSFCILPLHTFFIPTLLFFITDTVGKIMTALSAASLVCFGIAATLRHPETTTQHVSRLKDFEKAFDVLIENTLQFKLDAVDEAQDKCTKTIQQIAPACTPEELEPFENRLGKIYGQLKALTERFNGDEWRAIPKLLKDTAVAIAREATTERPETQSSVASKPTQCWETLCEALEEFIKKNEEHLNDTPHLSGPRM